MDDQTVQRAVREGELDGFIDPDIRQEIETRYLAPITARGRFDEILRDPAFLCDPVGHPALFADHGITHARDVAHQILHVLDAIHGRLIPERSPDRLGWMKAYGVLLALVHDIGMIDDSPEGRRAHPEVAARMLNEPGFDRTFEALLTADRRGIASRLRTAFGAESSARVALRGMIAMAMCHSKRKVPAHLLNDPSALQRCVAAAVGAEQDGAFGWLTASGTALRELRADVVDTLRALRCADALRMRGTVLKTSGQHEVFVDQRTANAVYAFRTPLRELYLLEVHDPVAVGEANLSGCQFDGSLDLRLSFHHGMFGSKEAVARAAACAARLTGDICADALESFVRTEGPDSRGLIRSEELKVLIEAPEDNPGFAGLVLARLREQDPALAARGRIVPSLEHATPAESARYRAARDLDWTVGQRREILDRIGRSGYPAHLIDPSAAFRHVRVVRLAAGETLIEAGAPSGFVYVPLGEGLGGRPLGDYAAFEAGDGMLVGLTGVVRGAARNAEVVAKTDLALLAIPRAVFLESWYFTYGPETLAEALRRREEVPH